MTKREEQGGEAMSTIRALRLQRGWTGVELARRSRIHPADISRFERGRMVPYAPQARRLARTLGVTVEALGLGALGASPQR